MSKKFLATVLAALLIAAMIPFSALAATYITVEGNITTLGSNYITVSIHGADELFYITPSTQYNSDFISVGDRIRVLFKSTDPTSAVQITVLDAAKPARLQHSHYSVIGTITDAGMSTITIITDKGTYRTFSKEDANVISSDGLLLGDRVKITYAAGNKSEAVEISVIAHGDNHKSHNHKTQTVSPYSATGTVVDAGMSTITIVGYKSNTYRTFSIEDAEIIARDGILLGDVIRITYNKNEPDIATKVEMITQGGNH